MVDLVLALTILVVAVGGLASTIVSTARLARTNEETADAYAALRQVAEEMQAVQFDQIFTAYTNVPDFAAGALAVQEGDADGFVGSVSFPTQTVGGVLQLREDVIDADLGMPRDLNGDGAIDDQDHSGDYAILPVSLQVQWEGANGPRTLELSILLTEL